MTRLRQRVDLPFVTVCLMAVIAALPFLTQPGLPRHTDLELHVYRAAEYGNVWADGVLYPRWAPNFYHGYGYPIFNYYAPFTYALANVFAFVPGIDIVGGVKGVILAAYLLGALGAYFFARRHFGSAAGVIASAAFVLSPYFLFVDPLMRGDLAEFFALSVWPWVFVAFDRPRFSIAQPLVLAIFIFSHNLLAVMGGGLLVAYVLWRGLFVDGTRRWRGDAGSIALALALTAILWLPFLAERGAIRLNVAGPGHFDYHNHFVSLAMLLAPSPPLDFGATAPKYIYNIGLIQWLLFIPAIVMGLIRRHETAGRITLFFGVVSAGLVFLMTPTSTFIWDAIPSAAFVQFPWRLLGPAAFTLSICAAAAVSAGQAAGKTSPHVGGHPARFGTKRLRETFYASRIVVPLTLAALLVAALPTMYPPLWEADFGDTSARGSIAFELSGVALGTTSTGDFLPKPVGIEPAANQALIDSYASGPIDKFDRTSLPAGASAQVERHTAIEDRFRVNSPQAFRARVLTFLFPGWHTTIDGVEVPMKPEDQSGLITFDVPAGSHVIDVSLQSTTPQLIGALISALGLLLVAGVVVWRKSPAVSEDERHTTNRSFVLGFSSFAVCLVFLIAKLAVFDRCDTCFRYTSPPGQVLGAHFKQVAHFGGHIDLLGYDLPMPEVEAGGMLPLTLYWKATAPVPENYQVFAHIGQPGVEPWGQSDKLNPGDFPSTRWPLDKYVWDDHTLKVRADTPPGEYELSVGLYLLESGTRVPVFDDSGQIIADQIVLTTVKVTSKK